MSRPAPVLTTSQDDASPEGSDLARAMASHALRWLSASARHQLGEKGCRLLETEVIALVRANEVGHVCARVSSDAATRTLLESGLVGRPEFPAAHPFILDQEGRFYLHRVFDEERRLAREVLRRSQAESLPVGKAAQTLLEQTFEANARRLQGRPDRQKQAVALALLRPLVWIHGGPGTGKTSTVVNLMACLLAQAPHSRIALAAPTGKAAARLLESVHERAEAFEPMIRAALPAQAWTLHRLLGLGHARSGERSTGSGQSALPFDLIVVDEASMLDLRLAVRLFEAAGDQTRLVLLGDRHQLAAVEAGAVFAELAAQVAFTPVCAARLASLTGETAATAREVNEGVNEGAYEGMAEGGGVTEITPEGAGCTLPDTVMWLTERHRFAAGSAIDALASAVCAGDSETALSLLGQARQAELEDGGLRWIETGGSGNTNESQVLREALQGYASYRQALGGERAGTPADPVQALSAFSRFRILCAVHEGPQGVNRFNRECEEALRRLRAGAGADTAQSLSPWYPGRPVMVRRNDYRVELFNGDIGIALADSTGALQLCFATGPAQYRRVPTAQMPEHVSAFALTVHAAQGSQFEETLVVLPGQPSRVLTRELLYTALTRSTRRVIVAGSRLVIETAIRTPTRRHSGLAARIREAGPDQDSRIA